MIVVLVLVLAYKGFESHVIVPRIYGRALRLPSSVILFSLLAGGVLLGITGALLALPVAAAVLMLIEELRVELPGQQEQAEDVETKERDDRGEEEYERRAEGMPAEQSAAIAVTLRHLLCSRRGTNHLNCYSAPSSPTRRAPVQESRPA